MLCWVSSIVCVVCFVWVKADCGQSNFGQSNFGQSIFGQSIFVCCCLFVVVVVRVGGVVVGLDHPPPDTPPPDTPPPDRPKFRAFFFRLPSPIRSFCLSLCVFSLNFGGICEDRDPCALLGSRAVVGNPGGFGAAAVSHDNPRTPTCTFERPGASNTAKIPREDPPEREERMKFPAGERKKSAKFWALPSGPNPSGPTFSGFCPPLLRPPPFPSSHHAHRPNNTPTASQKFGQMRSGQIRSNKFGQIRLAKCGQLSLANCGIGQMRFGQWPNQV